MSKRTFLAALEGGVAMYAWASMSQLVTEFPTEMMTNRPLRPTQPL